MVAVSEVFKAWKEGLANKDSSKIGEFFADDFVFIRPTGSVDLRGGTRTRQETLDWTAAGGSPTTIDDNLQVLYENDDVAVIVHGVNGDIDKLNDFLDPPLSWAKCEITPVRNNLA